MLTCSSRIVKMMYAKRLYPYSQTFEDWEKTPQLGIEPVYFENGLFHICRPTWTEQVIAY